VLSPVSRSCSSSRKSSLDLVCEADSRVRQLSTVFDCSAAAAPAYPTATPTYKLNQHLHHVVLSRTAVPQQLRPAATATIWRPASARLSTTELWPAPTTARIRLPSSQLRAVASSTTVWIQPRPPTATAVRQLWPTSRTASATTSTWHAYCQQQSMDAWQPPSSSATASDSTIVRRRRTRWLLFPVLSMQWTTKSASDRNQLLRSTRAAPRLHQRCEEHEHIPKRVLRIQARRHGNFD